MSALRRDPMRQEPIRQERVGELPVWRDELERDVGEPGTGSEAQGEAGDRVEVRFAGRGPVPRPSRRDVLAALEPRSGPRVAWAEQIHSARVLEAHPVPGGGSWGEGDALVTDRAGLALSVVTADCVPVLLASCDPGGPIAALHAGWRGIAAGIVARVLERLEARLEVPAPSLVAWIGPAIGPCCYEVGEDVAERVVRVSTEDVVRRPPEPGRGRPHLDLGGAVRLQLVAAGVGGVRSVERCTRCHPGELWSYRRDGEAAGRNLSFVWVARPTR